MSVAGTTYNVVAGWTAAIDIDLKDDGATPSGTLGGTVELILKNSAGTQLPFTGDVTIQDATNWRVRVSPDAGDFVAGIYRGRIKVTDATGKVAYFPNGAWDVWICNTEA